MAEPYSALERLDYQTPIPCYYIDMSRRDDCETVAHMLVTRECSSGHRLENPYCVVHATAMTGDPRCCLACGGMTRCVYVRPVPPDYWPGEDR
jgi:hypothetical protein